MSNSRALLIIEDDATVARGLLRVLQAHGWECEWVTSREQASKLLGPWFTAVVDLHLPDGSGFEIVELLGSGALCSPPVFFSATLDPEERAKAEQLGHFVSKEEGAHRVLEVLSTLVGFDALELTPVDVSTAEPPATEPARLRGLKSEPPASGTRSSGGPTAELQPTEARESGLPK